MEVEGKKVLVTGSCGFIGSHLVERLVKLNCNVRALTHYNSFNSWGWLDAVPQSVRDSIEVVPGDVRDPFFVANVVSGCEIVFHLAALIAIPYSYHAPSSYVETNVTGTLNVVQAAREHSLERVVVTSTSEVYGSAEYVPIDEKHRMHAQSPYAATKIAADQIALSFYRSFDTPITVVRPFNTYGPRQSLRAIIPTIITQIGSGKLDLELGALDPTRDFNYVEDTVSGFIKIAESDQSIGEEVNVGSGKEISIGDLVQLIAKQFGKTITMKNDHRRLRPEKSEVNRLLASNKKLYDLVGWTPKVSLKDGLEKTIRWFTDKENLKFYGKINQYNV